MSPEMSRVLRPAATLALLLWMAGHGAMTAGCRAVATRTVAPPLETQERWYRTAIADAAVRNESQIYDGLLPLATTNGALTWRTADRQEVLVVSFMPRETAGRYYADADGSPRTGTTSTPRDRPRVWVTLAPELRRFCRTLDGRSVAGRLKQYLGLNPAATHDTVVEMWVSPADVFRPCLDPQTDDNACSLTPPGTAVTVKNIDDYSAFLVSLYIDSYRDRGAPWTGLGYTYDYAGARRAVGASEYMLVPGAEYEVSTVSHVNAYCSNPDR